MIWADKIAAGLFLAAALLVLLMGLGPPAPAFADISGWERWGAYVNIMTTLGLKIFVPIWVLLRVVDLIAGGPASRARARALRREDSR